MAINWDRTARTATPKGWKVQAVELQGHGDVSMVWDTGVDDENRFAAVLVTVEDVQREGKKQVGPWLKKQLAGHAKKLAMVRAMGQGDVENAVHPPEVREKLAELATKAPDA